MVLKRIVVVVLSVVLCVSLLGANAAVALDRGALDAGYMKETADREGLYEGIQAEAVTAVTEEVPDTADLPIDVDVGALVADALTAEYIRNQSERNIDRTYAYLHGEGELEVVLDTRPLKENVVDALVERVDEIDVADLVGEDENGQRLANLTASEESYEAEREAFRRQLKDELLAGTGVSPDDDFGSERLAALAESEESYEAEREAVRERMKAALVAETGLDPENDFGSDVLANLAESEESYGAEREAFEADRKREIQESTSRRLSERELDRAYEESLDEIRAELRDQLEAEYLGEDTPEPLQEPASDLIDLTVDALTTDMGYEEFAAEYDAVKTDVDAALDAVVEENPDEFRDELRGEIENELPLPDDAPESVQDTADDLVDLVLDAYTTDMPYGEFAAEYEAIKAAFDEDLDRLLEEQSDEFLGEFRDQITAELDESDMPGPFQDGMRDLIDLLIEAMTTDMSYEAFTAELDSIKQTMAQEGGEYLLNEHEGGVPDRIELTEEMDGSASEDLEPVRGAVSTIGLLAWVLPVLSLGTVGGMYGVSRRADSVALAAGVVALVVGGVSAGVARVVPDQALAMLEVDASAALVEPVEGIVRALFAPLWTQSLALLVLGVVLVGLGIALRYDLGPFADLEL